MIRTQIDKKSIKIAFKIYTKINHKIDTIFYRFLIDFWSILAPFWGPKSLQNRTKMQSKKLWIFESIFYRFFIDFDRFGVPKRGSTKGPRTNFSRSFWLLEPRWPQDPPKMALRSDFHRIFIDFWSILLDFWSIFYWFLIDFSLIFVHQPINPWTKQPINQINQ